MGFYDLGRGEKDFELGIETAIARILASPQFIYRIEEEPAGVKAGQAYRITDIDLASRLSFFLWSRGPDETLLNVAAEYKVSLDWLMGLSQDEGLSAEIRPSLEIEEGAGGFDRTLLARWHAEAAGSKIRYVPAGIPDLLRSDELIAYEAGISQRSTEAKLDETQADAYKT